MTKAIDKYTQIKHDNENDSLEFSKLNMGDVQVTKSVSKKNPKTFHYWFEKNGKTYEAFTWSGNHNSDAFLTNLIVSMKPGI